MNRTKGLYLAAQVVLMALGIYFLTLRQQALTQLVTLIAVLVLVLAAYGFARYFMEQKQGGIGSLAGPCLTAVLGAVLFIFREGVTGIVPFLLGIWALVTGALTVASAFKEKSMKLASWWRQLPQAGLRVALGVLILTGVLNLNALFTVVLGIYLIVLGAVNLVVYLTDKGR